jgi:protein tyrosine phosphatase
MPSSHIPSGFRREERMTSDLMPSQIDYVGVSQISQTMFTHARGVIAGQAKDEKEFDQFMAMLTPDPWRCAYCDQHYVIPSLARDCEAHHERKKR